MKTNKLSAILALTDKLSGVYAKSVEEYNRFFRSNDKQFEGEKRTYVPYEGTMDQPSKRSNVNVVTTVEEKLKWFVDTHSTFIDALLDQEATNASGLAKAPLIVEGEVWGEFSSIELLRLKSILENGTFVSMLENIPVRDDDKEWEACTEEQYIGRKVFQNPKLTGVEKTTVKEAYILKDPNVAELKDNSKYTPVTGTKDTVMTLGDYTLQKFSGKITARERAELLRRRTLLVNAVIIAIKQSNDVDIKKSELNSEKLFGYLFDSLID